MPVKNKRHHVRSAGQKCCPFCLGLIKQGTVEYERLVPTAEGSIKQKAKCLMCGRRWVDVFTLTDVHTLCSSGDHEID